VEGMLDEQVGTSAYVGNTLVGNGDLLIAESCVCWVNESGQGFTLLYPQISLHAVSRDLSSFPHPCIYVMLDGKLNDFGRDTHNGSGDAPANADDDSNEEDEDSNITEIRFVPARSESLDHMFKAMTEGNQLHPDEEDSFSEEDDDEFDPSVAEPILQYSEPSDPTDPSMEQDAAILASSEENADQFENADDEEMS